MKIGSLFSGYGGLDQAVAEYTGGHTVWVSDIDKGANKVLAHRYPDAPNLGDISTVDWSTVEPVDILTGGFPCQDVSHAGKRAGIRPGTRSGLWTQMAYAIDQLQPKLVVIENVRGLLSAHAHSDMEPCAWCVGDGPGQSALRALGAVLGDLADLGYDAQWHGLRAAYIGAPHGRFRVFVVAYPADTAGHRWNEGRSESAGVVGGFDAAERGHSDVVVLLPTPVASEGIKPSNTMGVARREATGQVFLTNVIVSLAGLDSSEMPSAVQPERFGQYAPAIAHWEAALGRPAPAPTEPTGKNGAHRLSPAFVEWMMGLPAGWVTDVPRMTRTESLKALGNGVVPQQALAALRHMLG